MKGLFIKNLGEEQMNYSRYKEQTLAIFLAVLMISSIAMIATPAKAQIAATQPTVGALPTGVTPSITISTVSYLSVSPNPIGVNQPLLINVWTQPPININRQQNRKLSLKTPQNNTTIAILLQSTKKLVIKYSKKS